MFNVHLHVGSYNSKCSVFLLCIKYTNQVILNYSTQRIVCMTCICITCHDEATNNPYYVLQLLSVVVVVAHVQLYCSLVASWQFATSLHFRMMVLGTRLRKGGSALNKIRKALPYLALAFTIRAQCVSISTNCIYNNDFPYLTALGT